MKLLAPIVNQDLHRIKAGDWLSLSGVVYTARDTAHKYMAELARQGKALPFAPQGAAIYYAGPSPAAPGRVIGAIGPTTSYRMDAYTPLMADLGVKIFIGKGPRNAQARQALKRHGALYLAAVGGAAAWLARSVKQAEIIAFPELGAEAVHKLYLENMELICINDCHGNDYYQQTARPADCA